MSNRYDLASAFSPFPAGFPVCLGSLCDYEFGLWRLFGHHQVLVFFRDSCCQEQGHWGPPMNISSGQSGRPTSFRCMVNWLCHNAVDDVLNLPEPNCLYANIKTQICFSQHLCWIAFMPYACVYIASSSMQKRNLSRYRRAQRLDHRP